jgi:hypothetical protein
MTKSGQVCSEILNLAYACTYKITLRRFRVTIVAVESKKYYIS